MRLTIKSRRLGHDVDFYWNPSQKYGSGYIYIDMTPDGGTPHQICEGGGFLGPTEVAYSEQDFETTSRKWWKDFLRHTRTWGY